MYFLHTKKSLPSSRHDFGQSLRSSVFKRDSPGDFRGILAAENLFMREEADRRRHF